MGLDLTWCTLNRLRSAKNVSKCGQNVIGAPLAPYVVAGFITPRSAVRSRPPLPISSIIQWLTTKQKNRARRICCKVAVVLLKNFASSRSKHSKTLRVLMCYCAFAAVLGSTIPTLEILSLHESRRITRDEMGKLNPQKANIRRLAARGFTSSANPKLSSR